MKINFYNQLDAERWDQFIETCPMGTFLHTRKFLSYHGDRFQDKSLIIADENDHWIAVLPAAQDPSNEKRVISHPGSSFGGIVHKGKLTGQVMIDALEEVKKTYKKNNFSEFIYKSIPFFYFDFIYNDDLYALFRTNAILFRRDLSCTIALNHHDRSPHENPSKMRNMMRKAVSNGVIIKNKKENIEEYWDLLNENLLKKYNKSPTHSIDEIKILMNKFPNNIELIGAFRNEKLIAGSLLFKNKKVVHTQYLTSSDEGKEYFALDMVIQYAIEESRKEGYRYFDFGISTEQGGHILNEGLHRSKQKHGGSGTLYDFYLINLE